MITTLIPRRGLTTDQIDSIVTEYASGDSTATIGARYGVQSQTICKYLKRRGVTFRVLRKHHFNQHYMDVIDTEAKAYILGLLCADGCNHNEKSVTIALQDRDGYLLEWMKAQFGYTAELRRHKPKTTERIKTTQWQRILNLHSGTLARQLARLGCHPRKSLTLRFPTDEQVPPHLIRHFMRGYYDGDGTISVYTIHGKYLKATWGIVGTKEVVDGFNRVLGESCQARLGVNRNDRWNARATPGVNCYSAMLAGNQQIIRVCRWLYDGATICLERKRDRYLQLVGRKHNKTKPIVATDVESQAKTEYRSMDNAAKTLGISHHLIRHHVYRERFGRPRPEPVNGLAFDFKEPQDAYVRKGRKDRAVTTDEIWHYQPIVPPRGLPTRLGSVSGSTEP